MSVDALLSKADGVKQTGAGRYLMKCRAHDDRRASLSVRELDDGRVLVHCFGGCGVAEVLDAFGLTFDDLFPPRAIDHCVRRERRPFHPEDVIRATAHEALVAGVTAARVAYGMTVDWNEIDRMTLAASRLIAAVDVLDRGGDVDKHNRARAEAICARR